MRIEFAHAWILALAWVIPALAAVWIVMLRRQSARLARFVAPALQPRLMPRPSLRRATWQVGLLAAALMLMLAAAAHPRWGEVEDTVYARGRDLIIALDVSRSMLANDVRPNRLERARTDLLDLIGELRGDRAGLLAFRRKATVLCPLTTDYAYVRQALEGATPDAAPAGPTDIGDAIRKALAAFETQQGSHRAIILISDGEDLAGSALEAAKEAAAKGVTIFTVGFGAQGGSRIPDPDQKGRMLQFEGRDVETHLDNETLYQIARTTGGAYIPVGTAGMGSTTLGTIYQSHLRRVAERDLSETLQRHAIERFQIFLLPAICLAIAACALSRGRPATGRARAPKQAAGSKPGPSEPSPVTTPSLRNLSPPPRPMRQAIWALALLGGLQAASGAGTNAPAVATNAVAEAPVVLSARATAIKAQRLFRLGRYEAAADEYLAAAGAASGDLQRRLRYNAAVADLKAGRHAAAADLFEELGAAAAKPDARLSLGLGAALYRQATAPSTNAQNRSAEDLGKVADGLARSAEAFRDASREDGEQALRNLAVARDRLPRAREEAKVAKLMETYGKMPPFQLVNDMRQRQRGMLGDLQRAATNTPPTRLGAFEALAKRQSEAADLWIPLKGSLVAAMSQQAASDTNAAAQMQHILQGIEMTRDSMNGTARMLRDAQLDPTDAIRTDERAVYGFWKLLAPSAALAGAALEHQTNAVETTAAVIVGGAKATNRLATATTDQMEARALTELFADRFPVEYPENAPAPPAPQAGTNAAPQLTPEDRQMILALTAEAKTRQEAAYGHLQKPDPAAALTEEQASAAALKQILELLPKPPPSKQQQKQDQQKQDQQKQDQQKQDQQKRGQQKQEQDQQDQQQQKDQKQDQQKQDQKPEVKTNATPEDVRELLEKALQREEEHKAELRERNRLRTVLPGEKVW
jgi:Ca-activated chloride channel family protein